MLGDPQFTGFRGQSYQVHGIDGAVYNLLSSSQLHVNARFVFLSSGLCPVLASVATNCWSHPGSYLGELGMLYRSAEGETEHRLLVEAGDRLSGFAAVAVDGQPLSVGTAVQPAAGFTIERLSSHQLRVVTPLFTVLLDNSDKFINQAVQVNVPLSQLQSMGMHGLLGQTHRRTAVGSTLQQVVEGDVDDYVVNDGGLFGTDCVYNRYN